MRSWSLETFIDERGIASLLDIWGVSRQALQKARENERDIQVLYVDGCYEIHETKLLAKMAGAL